MREHKACWLSAINSEMSSLAKYKTRVWVLGENAANILTNKFVFHWMAGTDQNGQIQVKLEAPLVTRELQQIQGIDYEETLAPVINFSTLRFMLAIAALKDLELDQMNVKIAFLIGDLSEDVYVEKPDGFVDSKK